MIFAARSAFLGRRSSAGSSYASLSWLGSVGQGITRTQVGTSSDRTRCTISFWARFLEEPPIIATLFNSISADTFQEGSIFAAGNNDMDIFSIFDELTVGQEGIETINFADTGWKHYVVIWETPHGTSDSRIRFYINGTLQTDAPGTTPGGSALFHFFNNAQLISIGGSTFGFPEPDLKMAFIDVLDGIIAEPTSFAFDSGGTWTRKPYAGSYGTYGFRIDGSNGINDASGNGYTFTNRGGTTLDTADLPPYTT